MVTYGIGGEERKANNAAEAISDIPLNRTLFVQKLTNDPAYKPEVVHDLKNIDDGKIGFQERERGGENTHRRRRVNRHASHGQVALEQ